MPRFHLHLENDVSPVGDVAGQELPSDDMAMKNAAATVAEVLCDELQAGVSPVTVKVTVENEAGQLVGTVAAQAVVTLAT